MMEETEIRRGLLLEISGYFREGWQTQEEGIAAAMEKMLMIGYVYGVGGKDVAIRTMNNLNMPARYIQPILNTLEMKP
jgi:hypothetical protein